MMFVKNEYLIQKDDDGMRLHKWMRKTFSKLPLSAVHRSLRTKKVRLNGKHAKGEEVLSPGDKIQIFFDPGADAQKKQGEKPDVSIPKSFIKKNFPVLLEDEEIIVINKPPNIPVHPGSKTAVGRSIIELANAKYPDEIIRLVHRIDKDTSGALLFAKNGGSLRILVKDLNDDKFNKEYLALVLGKLAKKSGTIDIALERQEKGKKMIAGKGKRAVTHYSVESDFDDCTLVRIQLETGRTHQIRAHFAAIGHPVLGDNQHGDFEQNKIFQKRFGLKRQFLHAHMLSFPHPKTGIQTSVTAELSPDLQGVLEKIRKR